MRVSVSFFIFCLFSFFQLQAQAREERAEHLVCKFHKNYILSINLENLESFDVPKMARNWQGYYNPGRVGVADFQEFFNQYSRIGQSDLLAYNRKGKSQKSLFSYKFDLKPFHNYKNSTSSNQSMMAFIDRDSMGSKRILRVFDGYLLGSVRFRLGGKFRLSYDLNNETGELLFDKSLVSESDKALLELSGKRIDVSKVCKKSYIK